jgi:hypothetical protein
MREIVVRDVEGRFLGPGRRWVTEYSDAWIFTRLVVALTAARALGVLCEVVEDHGVETERVLDTVG